LDNLDDQRPDVVAEDSDEEDAEPIKKTEIYHPEMSRLDKSGK
jgi:hypothetical protein